MDVPVRADTGVARDNFTSIGRARNRSDAIRQLLEHALANPPNGALNARVFRDGVALPRDAGQIDANLWCGCIHWDYLRRFGCCLNLGHNVGRISGPKAVARDTASRVRRSQSGRYRPATIKNVRIARSPRSTTAVTVICISPKIVAWTRPMHSMPVLAIGLRMLLPATA